MAKPESGSGPPVGGPDRDWQRAEAPCLLQGRQLAAASAEGLQLVERGQAGSTNLELAYHL